MSVVVMEPMVIRGRRPTHATPGVIEMEPLEIRGRVPLTNRAAGRLRESPDRARFGGFSYTRTAQDDAEVRAALNRSLRPPEPSAPMPARAPEADTDPSAPDRVRFGGMSYERTEEDDADVAAAQERERAVTGPGSSDAAGGPDAGASPVQPEATTAESGEPTEPVPGGEGVAPSVPATVPSGPAPAPTGTPDVATPSAAEPNTAGIDTPAALVTAARAAADALPHPEVPRAPLDRAFAPLVATAGSRAARPMARGGGGRYPPPRPVEPIEIDPVPDATAVLSTAFNDRLPDLTLPPVTPMPDSTVPTLGEVRGVSADELGVQVNLDAPAADAATVNSREASRSTAASRPVTDLTPPPVPVPSSPPVLLDYRRPPDPPLPAADTALENQQITRVLALVSATLAERAETLTNQVRDQAFPPHRMGNFFLEITNPIRDRTRTALEAKLTELRDAAGITVDVLNAAVATRRTELANHVTHIATTAELEAEHTAVTLTREAERENARTEAQRLRDQARQVARYRRALHSRDPTLVEELATARIGYIEADVTRGTVGLDAAKARRLDLIGQYQTAYSEAYRRADDAWQHPPGREVRAPPNLSDRLWKDVADDELTTAMATRRTQTENDAATRFNTLRDAGLAAKAAVRAWSDGRLRRTLTDDQRVARTTADINATNTAVTNARADAVRAATRSRLVGEIRFAAAASLRTTDDANRVSRSHMINLNADQLRDGQRFLAIGDPGDPMSAVANTLVQRYASENLREEPQNVRDAVYAKTPTAQEEANQLGMVYFPGGGAGLFGRVDRLWAAFEVWHGTAEEDVISALEGMDDHQTTLLNRAYAIKHNNESLQTRIDSEMSGSDFHQAAGLARGGVEGRREHTRAVIDASNGWFSNDPNRALEAIRALPPGEAAAVVNDQATRDNLNTVLGGTRWVDSRGSITDDRGQRELNILLDLNRPADATDPTEAARRRDLQARADAIEFDRAIRHGTGGDGPTTEAVVERIRQSVLSRAPPTWSADEVDNEVRRRMRAMENAYEHEFGAELPTGGVSALRTAVARYSYGTTLDLRTALLDVNRERERASRLQRTTEGVYTSDSELNTELKRTYDEAIADVRRRRQPGNPDDPITLRARELMAADGITSAGRAPSPGELAAYEQEAEEEAGRTLAQGWMDTTSRAFADRYGRRWGGGADPLREMVTSETQFAGETEAVGRLGGGGGLTAAQQVEIGQAGWGMDREMVLAGIGNRTTQQLGRISADYRHNTGGGDMLADLRSETGSWTDTTADRRLERDAFDIREAMRGVPTTPRAEFEAAERRYEYERDVYFGGDTGRPDAVSNEFATLQLQYNESRARMREYDTARASGDTAAMGRLSYALADAQVSVRTAGEAYRRVVDAHVEGVAQKVAIAVALAVVIIAAAVTTFFTAGAAAPAWVAVATAVGASLAGTAASMAVKSSMLGSAYGQNAIRTDLAVGAVDSIIAALTAGLGDKLLRLRSLGSFSAARTAAARTLASRAIAAERAARPLWQRIATFSAEQVAQSVPTALTGAALNRDTWRGDPLRNFLSAGGMAAATGIGLGAVMHHTMPHITGAVSGLVEAGRLHWSGSGAHITADSVTLASARSAAASGDVEGGANRGSWGERAAARRDFLKANPGATDGDFEIALLNGSIDTRARAEAVAATLPEMRAHLVSGLSGVDAELAGHARIEVLSDAEFFARTGSEASGYAATLNVRGEPVVVVREGAPLTRLAEEGRHVAQFFDPANASRLALIEEGRLANYATLSVPDQVAAWQAKIDLELDVAARQIPELRGRLESPNLEPREARDLARMLNEAEATVEVLSGRRALLNGLGVADIARMTSGDLPPPHFLADEPRLFAKAKKPPSLAAETFTKGGSTFETEAAFKAGSRWSRHVFVYQAGELREVVLQRWRNGSWQLSGRVGRDRGGIAEIAARIENALTNAADETSTVALRQYNGQIGSGAGLDDVWFRFETLPGGQIQARAQLYEVKNYADSLVSSFTAVDDNFRTNVNRVRERLREHLRDGSWEEAGMTRAQVEAAVQALDARQIDIIVRTTPSTRVNTADMSSLQGQLNRGRKGAPVRVMLDPNPVGEAAMLDAEELWLRMERFRQQGSKDPDNALFKALAVGPRGIASESIDLAEAVVAARSQPGSSLTGRIDWAPGRTHLRDGTGPFRAQLVGPPPAGAAFNTDAQARALLALVETGIPGIGAPGTPPIRLIVAYDQWLSSADARRLRRALEAIASAEGRSTAASKILWPSTPGTQP